jgi:DNA-binding LytR/AlgR family response regulator
MKCIVIDDEPLAREGMQLLIAEIPWLQHCGSFSDVLEADEYLKNNPVDLIFLDIQMPKITGLEYLRNTRSNTKIIITTAYPQFAVEGFELDVADYLVKPIRFERFYKSVSKLNALHQKHEADSMSPGEDDHVFIRSERKFIRTPINDIIYIEGLKDYVIIHCTKERLSVATNLKSIHVQLPVGKFMRINKSYIINTLKITSVERDFVFLDSIQLPIGENYRDDLLNYIHSKKILKR